MMKVFRSDPVQDFAPVLRQVLADIEQAGLGQVAEAVRSRCFAAYSTSSEYLGEVGAALTEILASHGAALPPSAREGIDVCLREVAKVWPKFRLR
jgi:hypothetical protein